MRVAYSFKLGHNVNINEVVDTGEIFGCLNRACTAHYKVRAINSNVNTHFGRLPSTKHIKGCVYNFNCQEFLNNSDMIKFDLTSIFQGVKLSRQNVQRSVDSNTSHATKKYIRTPKQLLYYCLANSIETQYTDKLAVNDIILDNRNLLYNGNFQGIEGLRLLLGQTVKYDRKSLSISLRVTDITVNNKCVALNAEIRLSKEQFDEILKFIFGSYDGFGGHYIAVLGMWSKTSKYNIETIVENPKNIIYKFAVDE